MGYHSINSIENRGGVKKQKFSASSGINSGFFGPHNIFVARPLSNSSPYCSPPWLVYASVGVCV